MKNFKLLFTSALLSGMLLFSTSIYLEKIGCANLKPNNKTKDQEDERGALGAAQWLFDIQKNQLTGIINEQDVLKAREEVLQRLKNKSAQAALGLEWNELGPDNLGGRTRAILIDKNNPNKIFAGSVSGGLFVSMDAGNSWSNVSGFDQQPILSITCITQAVNGDIYLGTGEDLFVFLGTGVGGILGAGIYKSIDGGTTFTLLPSTIPSTSNSAGNNMNTRFIGVNNLAVDPVNPNRIYAATRYGLQMSNDGGATWLHPIRFTNGTANTSRATDVDVANDGTVIAAVNGRGYLSSNGDSATFSIVSGGLPTTGIGRTEFAFAPSDPNYLYAVISNFSSGLLKAIYQSIDKGVNWSLIGNGGNSQFEIFGYPGGQGDYDMAVAVDPYDKTSIVVGGISLWEWHQTNLSIPAVGQWNRISLQNEFNSGTSIQNPYYVHPDVHTIKYSLTNPNKIYIGSDGGVFIGIGDPQNGMTFQPMNSGYNVAQLYSVAFEGDGVNGAGVMGGTQDNGTAYISGTGSYPYQNASKIYGGDGADCEISFLNPNASFSATYYGILGRHATKGGPGASFYSWNIAYQLASNSLSASFVTPIALYETRTATNSHDSILFINGPVTNISAAGDGINKHFSGYLNVPQASATIIPDSITFSAGLQSVQDDGTGIIIGDIDVTQNNTINYATGYYDFYFNTPPAFGAMVISSFDVTYAPGSTIHISRPSYVRSLNYTTISAINAGDTVMIYDSIQSKLAVGFTGHVYMTKSCLDFSITPPWFHIGTISGTSEELAWSGDGDILYVGTSSGNLYRFSNLASVKDSITGDIASPSCVVVKTQIGGFGGRFITGISVDPLDANKVAVSLGAYGNTNYIYYSETGATCSASTSVTNFSLKQGSGSTKLPSMPAYSVLIEKNDPKRVLVGTEYGVYSTDDITLTDPVWSSDNGNTLKLPNVPVFKIRQQRHDGTEVNNPYVIYAGTHGRGAWKSETFKGIVIAGIPNNADPQIKKLSGISIYPNPMTENGTIAFNLPFNSHVIISIYNLQGGLVKSVKSGTLVGENKMEINTAGFSKGTYLISIDGSAIHATSKFVVVK